MAKKLEEILNRVVDAGAIVPGHQSEPLERLLSGEPVVWLPTPSGTVVFEGEAFKTLQD